MLKNVLDGQDERELLGLIEKYRGRDNPIPAGKLTKFFNARMIAVTGSGDGKIPERRVRKLIRRLREKHGIPIGSATQPPAGYYIITDPDDLERNYQSSLHRALSILAMGAAMRNKTLPELLGQLRLEALEKQVEERR